MKSFLGLLVLIFFASYCDADTFSGNASLRYVTGMCRYNNKVYKPGEHYLPECTRLICSAKGWASVHNCIESHKEGCIRGDQIDTSKSFPECCKREYTCKHGDGSEYTITDY